jgi:hypothetical protein
LRLPDSKTGAKVDRLGAPPIDLLSGLPPIRQSLRLSGCSGRQYVVGPKEPHRRRPFRRD